MKIRTTRLDIQTCEGISYEDITGQIEEFLATHRLFFDGVCILTVGASETALTLCEDSEEEDDHDLIRLARDHMMRLANRTPGLLTSGDQVDEPADAGYVSSIAAQSITLPVSDGRLAGGSWERILLIDPRGPAVRNVDVTLLGG